MLDTRQLTVRRHLAASEAAERATADRMLPTDEERDQAFRRVFLDCLANALATKTIFVFQAHGDSFPSETEQDGRLQSVPFPLSFLPQLGLPLCWEPPMYMRTEFCNPPSDRASVFECFRT